MSENSFHSELLSVTIHTHTHTHSFSLKRHRGDNMPPIAELSVSTQCLRATGINATVSVATVDKAVHRDAAGNDAGTTRVWWSCLWCLCLITSNTFQSSFLLLHIKLSALTKLHFCHLLCCRTLKLTLAFCFHWFLKGAY